MKLVKNKGLLENTWSWQLPSGGILSDLFSSEAEARDWATRYRVEEQPDGTFIYFLEAIEKAKNG